MPSTPNIRMTDMMTLDDIFEMGGGYVLDFSNYTFARFFAEELNIDIDDPRYSVNGGSKGKRLRTFLQVVDKATTAKTLEALWKYREAHFDRTGRADSVKNAHGRFLAIVQTLRGGSPTAGTQAPQPAYSRGRLAELNNELLAMALLQPQPRGYAFEKFLGGLFTVFGMAPREPFRNRGEQIDGSFVLSAETYLLEAKWQNPQSGIADLHTFHGKVQEKATWARGLILSYSGFSPDGLAAFGRAKQIICMDGYDLSELLRRELPLGTVLEAKVRRAAETGRPFVRVAELFP